MPPPPGVHPVGRGDTAHWAHPGGAALVLQLPSRLRPPCPGAGPADLKPKTRHHYQSLLRQHILPTWQTVPLAKIAFEDLSQWGARLSASAVTTNVHRVMRP